VYRVPQRDSNIDLSARVSPYSSAYPELEPSHLFGTRVLPVNPVMDRSYASQLAAGSRSGALASRRTRLVQRSVNSLSDVNAQFMDTGVNGDEVCIAVVPRNRVCCWNCILEVPSGPNVLWSRFGANMGKLDPGMKTCWPVWNAVSALVSKQVITYNAVPKKCPTKDMVQVDVDLSINLRIGPDFARVEEFFFKMGPARLDAYLYFEVEECIRSLVNSVTYDRVNDLRSDFAADMLRILQSKLTVMGVDVLSVKITDVALPQELQARLESTTSFGTRIAEQEKNHKFALQQMKNDHLQKMAAITQSVNIERQRIAADTARYEITQDEKMSVAQSDRKVRSEEARGKMEVAVTKAKGALEVAQYEGRADAEKTVSTMNIKCEKELREAKLHAETSLKEAVADKRSSQFLARALETTAKADGDAATQLEEKVRFEHQTRLAEIDATLASNGRKFLSGPSGEAILKSFVMVRDDLA